MNKFRTVGLDRAGLLIAAPAPAQWPTYPTKNVPRTADGTPNLEAPAPRTADGHPDFTGVWLNEWFHGGKVAPPPVSPPGEPPPSTFGNVGANFPDGLPFQPWAAELKQTARPTAARTIRMRTACRWGIMQFHEQPAAAQDHPDARRASSSSTRATPASGRSSPTAVRRRTTTRSRGGTATRPAAGKATRSSSRRPGCATAAGSTSRARR